MKKILQKLASLLFIILTFSCAKSILPVEYTIKITPQKINREVKKHFPVKETLEFGEVTFYNPKVEIEKERIKINASYTVESLLFKTLKGNLSISGDIYYDRNRKTIFLKNPILEKLSLNGVFIFKLSPKKVENVLSKLAIKNFMKIPIYKFKDETANKIKSIKVTKDAILVTLTL